MNAIALIGTIIILAVALLGIAQPQVDYVAIGIEQPRAGFEPALHQVLVFGRHRARTVPLVSHGLSLPLR